VFSASEKMQNRLNGFAGMITALTPRSSAVLIRAHQIFTRLSAGRTIAEPSGMLNAF
jgi:hypothetical protein